MSIDNPFDYRLKMFLISQGDHKLAKAWLGQITEIVLKGENLPQQQASALGHALLNILQRDQASEFWNLGKKPDRRLDVQKELKTWKAVREKMESGESRADAIYAVADDQALIHDQSSEADEDKAIRQITNEYEYCQRKFKKMRKDRDHAFKQNESLISAINNATTNPR